MLRTVLATAAVFAAPASAIALQKSAVNPEHPTDASGGAPTAASMQMASLAPAADAGAPAEASPATDALLAYAALQEDINALRAMPLKTSADVEKALKVVVRHDAMKVAQGFYVYLGMTAAQNPAFAAESRSLVQAYGRDTLLDQLPRSTFGGKLRAAPEATSLALSAAAADVARISDAAGVYHQHAIALQKQPWAKKPIPAAANAARLKTIRAAAVGEQPQPAPAMAARFDRQALAQLASDDPGALGGRGFWDAQKTDVQLTSYKLPTTQAVSKEPAFATAMNKALTYSILYTLEAEDENAEGLSKLLSDAATHTAQCIELKRMSFFNAVAIARDQTESVAAVRDHLDTYAECLGKVSEKAGS